MALNGREYSCAVVVNYFNPAGHEALQHQTKLCLLRYLASTAPISIALSDGSGVTDELLHKWCVEHAVEYVASEKALSFAEGYNQGIRWAIANLKPDYIALSANDILVEERSIEILISAIYDNAEVGCVMPYLTQSDYWAQNDYYFRRDRFSSMMTLNLNVFRSSVLEKIGLVPEQFSGYYNDIAMMIVLKGIGLKVLMKHAAKVTHLQRGTIAVATTARFEADRQLFAKNHPDYVYGPQGYLLKLSHLSQGRLDRLWCRIGELSPSPLWQRSWLSLTQVWLMLEKAWWRVVKNI